MQLTIDNIGKHYNSQWLFRKINFTLKTGECIAVLGKNGSGKSTLLQVLFGLIQASEGQVLIDNQIVEEPHRFFNITSPLLTLPPEFSIAEIFEYQRNIKQTMLPLNDFLELAEFTTNASTKPLRYFSSGMLQRLKTAMCIYNTNPVKLLDEPLSNMDKDGEKWYLNCMDVIMKNHIVIVASNYTPEYQFAVNVINL